MMHTELYFSANKFWTAEMDHTAGLSRQVLPPRKWIPGTLKVLWEACFLTPCLYNRQAGIRATQLYYDLPCAVCT